MALSWLDAIHSGAGQIGGGIDITVEPLPVTENGTYTAEEGKAYSPNGIKLALFTKEQLIKIQKRLDKCIKMCGRADNNSIFKGCQRDP